ncbi:helix-turn-helix transcriptional regulator [Rhodocytophaga rosea]|uniref:Helix-turn-helix transcriptional regulator n=1 Tax=Rhodocytophaga rosea TaxID=2704465 RepID=A0A6C0GR42_9BACT|nr:helix-turn-helix transcriptional regulator [Rhodocytophaga rosea]QHT70531.1 helix-turn-helix transcriptional regulator [Rhodocytophaga rosea]
MSIVSNNIKYLRRMNGLTQEQFARKIGIKRSLLGAYEEARANPNLDNLMNIAKIFGTTVDNLLKNDMRRLKESKGVPLPQPSQQLAIKEEPEPPKQLSTIIDKYYRSEQEARPSVQPFIPAYQPPKSAPVTQPIPYTTPLQTIVHEKVIVAEKQKQTIEWVSQKDMGEYLSSYAYTEYIKQLPVFQLPMLPPGKYRAFEAGSDFMQPGSVIIGQFVNNWYEIKDGQNYLLVIHKQGIIYRRVYNQVKIKGALLLSSDNAHLPTHEVSIKEVLEIWEAKAFLSMQMPEPSAIPSLNHLSEMVRALQLEIERLKH